MVFRCFGKAAALILPLVVACSPAGAETPSHALPMGEPILAQTALRQVPPNGLDSLDEAGFRYFQTMGPLEYAARLAGTPNVPTWRVRLRLVPEWQDFNLTYQVKVDHYNLSPSLYGSLVDSYGADNVDPSLDNTANHQHLELVFFPVMNVAADWLSEATVTNWSGVDTNPTCGLGFGCASLEVPSDEWAGETTLAMEAAPWDRANEPIYMMVRALAQRAGWLKQGWTMPNEIPEGTGNERPWVEVLITNYPGNGGGYLAQWIERGADDSVRATVHQIYYDDWMEMEGSASTGYLCQRGSNTSDVRTLCP